MAVVNPWMWYSREKSHTLKDVKLFAQSLAYARGTTEAWRDLLKQLAEDPSAPVTVEQMPEFSYLCGEVVEVCINDSIHYFIMQTSLGAHTTKKYNSNRHDGGGFRENTLDEKAAQCLSCWSFCCSPTFKARGPYCTTRPGSVELMCKTKHTSHTVWGMLVPRPFRPSCDSMTTKTIRFVKLWDMTHPAKRRFYLHFCSSN